LLATTGSEPQEMLQITKAGYHGILLPQLGIGLDYSGNNADHIFISHAHADHMPRNRKLTVHATPPTAEFMKKRGFSGIVNKIKFGESMETEQARITLFPAGHILGSAMIFVESEFGNLLYTGDYRTPPSPATEGFELPAARIDYFITEATFGLPIYKWKSHEELAAEIRDFADGCLQESYTPVFLAYNLGKAQELMYLLKDLDRPMQIHGAGYKLCSVYEKYGFPLGQYESYDRNTCEGKILLTPSSALNNGFASNVKKKRIAYCSGWAAMESRRTQLTVDKLIPISDHLDFFELIRLCEKIRPKKVFVTHTPNPDVVQHYLHERGIESTFLDLEVKEED